MDCKGASQVFCVTLSLDQQRAYRNLRFQWDFMKITCAYVRLLLLIILDLWHWGWPAFDVLCRPQNPAARTQRIDRMPWGMPLLPHQTFNLDTNVQYAAATSEIGRFCWITSTMSTPRRNMLAKFAPKCMLAEERCIITWSNTLCLVLTWTLNNSTNNPESRVLWCQRPGYLLDTEDNLHKVLSAWAESGHQTCPAPFMTVSHTCILELGLDCAWFKVWYGCFNRVIHWYIDIHISPYFTVKS